MIYVLYSDYTKENNKSNIHGGNTYTIRVLNILINHGFDVNVLVPYNYKFMRNDEKQLFNHNKIHTIEYKNLKNLSLCKNDIFFAPLIRTSQLYVLKDIKKKFPNSKIYITIHGVRAEDLKYDYMDRYYYDDIYFFLYCPVMAMIKKMKYLITKIIFRKYIPYVDKVFTVSNYSLKQIIKIYTPQFIKPFYCGTNLLTITEKKETAIKYILFGNAGRPEKNFLRTLLAFVRFKKRNPQDVFYLYATGISQKQIKAISRHAEWDEMIITKWVRFYDYLDIEKYQKIYSDSSIILFTSKSEGFGLPIIEACMYGKAIIAAYGSAIPEVAETTAMYVNPYDINSIMHAIEKMINNREYVGYGYKSKKYFSVMKQRIKISDDNFIDEFT